MFKIKIIVYWFRLLSNWYVELYIFFYVVIFFIRDYLKIEKLMMKLNRFNSMVIVKGLLGVFCYLLVRWKYEVKIECNFMFNVF